MFDRTRSRRFPAALAVDVSSEDASVPASGGRPQERLAIGFSLDVRLRRVV